MRMLAIMDIGNRSQTSRAVIPSLMQVSAFFFDAEPQRTVGLLDPDLAKELSAHRRTGLSLVFEARRARTVLALASGRSGPFPLHAPILPPPADARRNPRPASTIAQPGSCWRVRITGILHTLELAEQGGHDAPQRQLVYRLRGPLVARVYLFFGALAIGADT